MLTITVALTGKIKMDFEKPIHDNRHLYDLDYKLDYDIVYDKFLEVYSEVEPYEDSRYDQVSNWRLKRVNDWEYADKIMSDLNLKDFVCDYRPRFYTLDADTYLITHTDLGTKCSLNFVISGGDSPVIFEGEINTKPDVNSRFYYLYQAALFNTTLPHGVVNGSNDRILFKISIFDKTYEEVRAKIKEHGQGNLDILGGDPIYKPFRDLFNNQKALGDKYYDLHTSNLIPTNIKIDLDLFHEEVQDYQHLFEQWGNTHSDLPRTGMALTLPDDYPKDVSPNPANWPMDVWAVNHPEYPLVDSMFTNPTEPFNNMKSLAPLMVFKEYFGRCNLLRWHQGAKFYPHMDVFYPFHNLRLWGTNDPDNYYFMFWDEKQGKYIREENVEAGRIYVADTEKWHHAYTTGNDNYTFFISLQVDAYDTIKQNLL